MSDTAAHLVDEVFPEVPTRQWVFTAPWRLRYPMAYDRRFCSDVLDAFISSLRRSLRWRAKRKLGLRSVEQARFGAITFIQRADSALRLNVHFHCVVLDGVYIRDDAGELHFHELGTPTAEEVAELARWTHERLERVLERHGRSLDEFDDAQEQLVLASCYGAAVGDRQLLGEEPGRRTRKLVEPVLEFAKPGEALADVGGVNIHAGVAIPPRDRRRLERLCRYVARPPLCQDRLERAPDGRRVTLAFKHSWKDGTRAVVLDPLDLIARLVALVPPPNFHLLRYHGVLAGHSKVRSEVVPGPASEPVAPTQLPLAFDGETAEPDAATKRSSRHPWAWLLRRVFAVDVTVCPLCRGPMKLMKIANEPDAIARALARVGLGPRPPPRPRPAPPGQLEFDFVA